MKRLLTSALAAAVVVAAGTAGEAQAQAESNYQLARRYFSFTVLERRLLALLADCFGQQT